MAKAHSIWDKLFIAAVVCLVAFAFLRPIVLPVARSDHYLYLAEHLISGNLNVNDIPADYSDVITWNGNKYLPFGPFPAVVVIPFIPFMHLAGSRDLVWIGFLITLANIFLLSRVLTQMGIVGERRKWALLLFFGSTVYYASTVLAATWYFAHLVVTACFLLAITEALGKKRLWLVGIFVALAGATRLTALFALPFFMWLVWWDGKRRIVPVDAPEGEQVLPAEKKAPQYSLFVRYAWLLSGFAVPLILLGLYNNARFNSPLESGYEYAVLMYTVLEQARQHGVFSIVHIPKNLFMLLLQGPEAYPAPDAPILEFPYFKPSEWGMGLIYVSPALFFAFRAKIKEPFVQACWLAAICIMIPVITYYGVGWVQFGYRYGLDFIPFLFLLAAIGIGQPVSRTAKVLILLGVAVNIWGAYWLSTWV